MYMCISTETRLEENTPKYVKYCRFIENFTFFFLYCYIFVLNWKKKKKKPFILNITVGGISLQKRKCI